MDDHKSNIAKGRNSYDANIDGTIIPFFNKNVSPYPTEAGGPQFDLVPVTKQKDIMINHARIYAQQEYDRIMELVAVLEKQAQQIKRRLDITDLVYAAEYQFQVVLGQSYWLVWDKRKEKNLLVHHGPNEWSTGAPVDYDYLCKVKYMGDHTWMEVSDES
jgi:hypothetical protein